MARLRVDRVRGLLCDRRNKAVVVDLETARKVVAYLESARPSAA